jgi:hypothetical protein
MKREKEKRSGCGLFFQARARLALLAELGRIFMDFRCN